MWLVARAWQSSVLWYCTWSEAEVSASKLRFVQSMVDRFSSLRITTKQISIKSNSVKIYSSLRTFFTPFFLLFILHEIFFNEIIKSNNKKVLSWSELGPSYLITCEQNGARERKRGKERMRERDHNEYLKLLKLLWDLIFFLKWIWNLSRILCDRSRYLVDISNGARKKIKMSIRYRGLNLLELGMVCVYYRTILSSCSVINTWTS